ncbi:MAG: phosphatidylglycerophosphatase A [Ignavibacteria bacterium]|nr:phosphatidylglycerophosphatase A [Ignavibacteria bacterium]
MDSQVGSQNPSDAASTPSEQVAGVPFLTKAFGSAFFSGYSPAASGTVGTAVGLAIYFIPGFEQVFIILPACLIVFLLGIRAAGSMERAYGHDPGEVTIDEVLGMWISLLFLPKSLLIAFVAFFLFRILDIVKPFPARRFDDKKGGLGIMADDVICGIYTNIILQILVVLNILR